MKKSDREQMSTAAKSAYLSKNLRTAEKIIIKAAEKILINKRRK